MFDREKAINQLTDLMFDEFNQGALSLTDLILYGFKGVNDMTDEEIMQELTDRDVSYLFGDNDSE